MLHVSLKLIQQPTPMRQQHPMKNLQSKFCRNHQYLNYGGKSFME